MLFRFPLKDGFLFFPPPHVPPPLFAGGSYWVLESIRTYLVTMSTLMVFRPVFLKGKRVKVMVEVVTRNKFLLIRKLFNSTTRFSHKYLVRCCFLIGPCLLKTTSYMVISPICIWIILFIGGYSICPCIFSLSGDWRC